MASDFEYQVEISETKNRTLVAEQTVCDCGLAFAKPAKTEIGDIVILTPEDLNIEESVTLTFRDYNTIKEQVTNRFNINRTSEVAHTLYFLLKDGVCQSLHQPQ